MTIRLLVSDVDGTLVAPDKSLPASAIAAAGRLREAGVLLALVSARPPFGMRYVAEGTRPAAVAGFNGGTVLDGTGRVLERHLLSEDAGRDALALLAERGVPGWLFTGDEWLITDPEAHYVPLETRTVRQGPRVVPSLQPYLGQCGKIVGSTADHGLLAAVEGEMQAFLGERATARRSQLYYLDVTHRDANKGFALEALCRQLGVTPAETACIGDAPNDLPMFAVAGFAIAMGNAEPEVQAQAAAVVGGNDGDGWAEAVDRIVVPMARRAA
ncbi:MAG: HAD family hydrolase [Acetobacteraceae bacterium]|nr:HAD family hydrolase [Acetobacteraceae bacterium]